MSALTATLTDIREILREELCTLGLIKPRPVTDPSALSYWDRLFLGRPQANTEEWHLERIERWTYHANVDWETRRDMIAEVTEAYEAFKATRRLAGVLATGDEEVNRVISAERAR